MTGQRRNAPDFDRLVVELQGVIDERERALYLAKVIEEARNPGNGRRMPDADGREKYANL